MLNDKEKCDLLLNSLTDDSEIKMSLILSAVGTKICNIAKMKKGKLSLSFEVKADCQNPYILFYSCDSNATNLLKYSIVFFNDIDLVKQIDINSTALENLGVVNVFEVVTCLSSCFKGVIFNLKSSKDDIIVFDNGIYFKPVIRIKCSCGKTLMHKFSSIYQPSVFCSCPNCGRGYLLQLESEYEDLWNLDNHTLGKLLGCEINYTDIPKHVVDTIISNDSILKSNFKVVD